MAFDDYLKQTAVVRELMPMKDAQGGVYQDWITRFSTPCNVQPKSGGVDREEAKDGSAATHNILLKGNHSLTARNQVVVDSLIYNVIRCNNWNSLGHHTTLECVVETS